MTYYCSSSKQYQNAKNTIYEETEFDQDEFQEIVKYDHCPSVVSGGRSKSNFVRSHFLYGEVDGGLSIPEFKQKFKGIAFLLSTSRNHQKPKDGAICDRYHVFFPLDEPIEDVRDLDAQLRSLVTAYPFFDSNAKDATRFYFGNRDARVHIGTGRPHPLFESIVQQPTLSIQSETVKSPFESAVYEDDQRIMNLARPLWAKLYASGFYASRHSWIQAMHAMKLEGFPFSDFLLITDQGAEKEADLFWRKCVPDGTVTMGTLVTHMRSIEPKFPDHLVPVRPAPDASTTEGKPKSLNVKMSPTKWHEPHMKLVAKEMKPLGTLENFRILMNHYGIKIRENLMTHDIIIEIAGNQSEGKGQNAAWADLASLLVLNDLGCKDQLKDYVTRLGHENAFHPARDYFKALEWDGKSRLGELMSTLPIEGGFDKDFAQVLVVKWLISVAAAACHDNFRNRGVLTFQGKQSGGKSSWFRSLFKDASWFYEGANIDTRNKDSIEKAISHLCCELGELEGIFKRADIPALKAFLTSQTDIIRMPYERRAERYQRRTVYCATVNKPIFLVDDENTRYWTIPVGNCNFNFLENEIDRDQLWAEVYALYKAGKHWWLTQEEERKLAQTNEHHEETDEVTDAIKTYWNLSDVSARTQETFERLYSATEIAKIIGYNSPSKLVINKVGATMRLIGIDMVKASSGKRGYRMPEHLNESEIKSMSRIETWGSDEPPF